MARAFLSFLAVAATSLALRLQIRCHARADSLETSTARRGRLQHDHSHGYYRKGPKIHFHARRRGDAEPKRARCQDGYAPSSRLNVCVREKPALLQAAQLPPMSASTETVTAAIAATMTATES